MKEYPIPFSGPMIRAILDGRKTQTRRIIKPAPGPRADEFDTATMNAAWQEGWIPVKCRHGKPGDRLWVRENFSGPYACRNLPPRDWPRNSRLWFWADGNPDDGDYTKPKPSIHLPRWASRIELEVTDVRVERLQDISEADADAEGFGGDFPHVVMPDVFSPQKDWSNLSVAQCYLHLWDHINGAGSSDTNPWVWVVEFKRVDARAVAA